MLLKHMREQHSEDETSSTSTVTVDVLDVNNGSKLFTRIQLPAKLYTCPVDECGLPFYSESGLNSHRKLHDEFTCVECPFRCDYAPELAIHEVKTHGSWHPDWPRCNRCKQGFEVRREVCHHHLTLHQGLSPDILHNCPICQCNYLGKTWSGLQFSELKEKKTSTRLFQHFKEQHDLLNSNPSFKCEETEDCGAYYLTQEQLDIHKERCHGIGGAKSRQNVREFKCGLCPEHKGFSFHWDLQAHRLRLHRESPKLIRCSREFLPGIERHVFRYGAAPANIFLDPFQAESCYFLFETELELQHHIGQTHDSPEAGNCPKCDKLFLTKHGLLLHLNDHKRKEAGKKKVTRKKDNGLPIQCQECGKSFRNKSMLKYHSVQHLKPEEWEHLCGVYGKRFKAAHFLRYHMNVHEKKKQFFCQKCPAGYRHHHHLRQHLRDNHGLKGEDIGPTLTQKKMMGLE